MSHALFLKLLLFLHGYAISVEKATLPDVHTVLLTLTESKTERFLRWYGSQFDDEPWKFRLLNYDPVLALELYTFLSIEKDRIKI
jgi:hypothetical protein